LFGAQGKPHQENNALHRQAAFPIR